MLVPRFGLIEPGQTHVCPQLELFMTIWLILQFWENCSQVCLLLQVFQDFKFLSLSVGFFGGKEGHTLQHPNVSVGLKRPNIRR